MSDLGQLPPGWEIYEKQDGNKIYWHPISGNVALSLENVQQNEKEIVKKAAEAAEKEAKKEEAGKAKEKKAAEKAAATPYPRWNLEILNQTLKKAAEAAEKAEKEAEKATEKKAAEKEAEENAIASVEAEKKAESKCVDILNKRPTLTKAAVQRGPKGQELPPLWELYERKYSSGRINKFYWHPMRKDFKDSYIKMLSANESYEKEEKEAAEEKTAATTTDAEKFLDKGLVLLPAGSVELAGSAEKLPVVRQKMRSCVLPPERTQVIVPRHPLIKHWVSVLRNKQTPYPDFRKAMAELGRLLIYEATKDCLPMISGEIQIPMGSAASVELVNPAEPVVIIPLLIAGLALAEHASSVLPATKTYLLGVRRDEETSQPSVYLNKLPDKFPNESCILVVDPVLATGGTVVAALKLIKDRGVDNKQIKVVSAVAAPPALEKLRENFPGVHVYTGFVDNEKGLIISEMRDAEDRCFDTQ